MQQENKLPHKIVIDTNIWVSFLIGKNLSGLLDYILNEEVLVCICDEQIEELKATFAKSKLQKYFDIEQITNFLNFINEYAENVSLKTKTDICRDKKDNFLVSLALDSQAEYLITGDNDLLILNPIESTQVIKYTDFEKIIFTF